MYHLTIQYHYLLSFKSHIPCKAILRLTSVYTTIIFLNICFFTLSTNVVVWFWFSIYHFIVASQQITWQFSLNLNWLRIISYLQLPNVDCSGRTIMFPLYPEIKIRYVWVCTWPLADRILYSKLVLDLSVYILYL